MIATALADAVRVYAPTLTPTALAGAVDSTEQTFTVPGLLPGDVVAVSGPAQPAHCALTSARVSAKDTLALTFGNFTTGTPTPTAGVYVVFAIRP